jgi:hypothetical protein
MLTQRTVILAKVESVYGSDPTPSNTLNAIEHIDAEISIVSDMKQRFPANTDMSKYPELRGKTHFEISFSTPIKASGTRGTASRRSPLFKACGMSETIVSATSVTYALISTSQGSCTIWAYIDGILYKLNGCVGDVEIDFSAGELGMYKWSFKGLYALPTDSAIVDPTFDTPTPVIVKGVTFTIGSYAAIINKLNLKLGNKIAMRSDFCQTDGVKGFQITGRDPEGSMTVEAVLMATSNANFLSYFDARTVKALSLALGATAGNIVTFSAPYCYLRAPKIGDEDGIRSFEIPFQLARSAGNDEATIIET